MTTKVFGIQYTNPDIIADTPYGWEALCDTVHIRATSPAEARRICKSMTGALIKNMRVKSASGYNFRADND